MKEDEGIRLERICTSITYGHRKQCGGGQREDGWELGGRGKGGKNRDISNSVNNEKKIKKIKIN